MSDHTTSLTKEDLYRAVKHLKSLPSPPPLPVRVSMSTEKLRSLLKDIPGGCSDEDIHAGEVSIFGMKVVLQEHLGEMVAIAMDNGGFLLWNGRAWLRIPPLEMVRDMRMTKVTLE